LKKIILVICLLISSLNANKLGIHEKLGEMVPLDLKFINEKGQSETLKQLMDGKPTILTLNYYKCSGICTPQLNDLAKMLSRLELAENTDYKVLTVSFAEEESSALAAAKRKNMLASMTRPFVADAWHFVVGENNSSAVLAKNVGFAYEKTISPTGQVEYIHPGVAIVLSPEGKVTRYLNGIDQLPFDVKMALIEASDGKVGPTIAKTLLFCFAYDSANKKYVFLWEKIGAIVMLTIVFGFFIYLIKTGRKEEDHQKDKEHQKEGKNDE